MFSKGNYQYALNPDEKTQIKTLKKQGEQPTIIAIYDYLHGTACADKTMEYFTSKGIKVVKVSSAEGLNHSIFESYNFNGIYLTGGQNIFAKELRATFEGQLLEIATQKDIPLFGICRGLQTFGYYAGCKVGDLPDGVEHAAPQFGRINIDTLKPVVVQPGSQLYRALQYKFKCPDDQSIEYPIVCLHEQHLIGELKDPIKITGRSRQDDVIESLERSTGKYTSFALQHHPELVIDYYKQRTKEVLQTEYEDVNRGIIDREKNIKEAKDAIGQTTQEEALWSLNKKVARHEASLACLMQKKQKLIKEMAHPKKSIEEQAARAELGLFAKQVKKQFLEQNTGEKTGRKKVSYHFSIS